METHSNILAWEVPWTQEPGGLHPWSRKELETTQRLNNNKAGPRACCSHHLLGSTVIPTKTAAGRTGRLAWG